MNRGSHVPSMHESVERMASMRPRFMNRGSKQQGNLASDHVFSFNEAPIHESGKLSLGFGIHQPELPASMRPRFMNRGSRPDSRAATDESPGFNEAPIHESGKSRLPRRRDRRRNLASMRPRFMNRGSPEGRVEGVWAMQTLQ